MKALSMIMILKKLSTLEYTIIPRKSNLCLTKIFGCGKIALKLRKEKLIAGNNTGKGGYIMKRKVVLKKIGSLFQLEAGFKPDYIIWVSPKLVTKTTDGYFLEFPVVNVELAKGKRDLILRPGSMNLFNVRVIRAMYGSWDEVDVEIDTAGKVYFYQSDPGYQCALVLTEAIEVEYRWKTIRNWTPEGQVVEEGFGVIRLDGTVEEVEGEKEDALASLE